MNPEEARAKQLCNDLRDMMIEYIPVGIFRDFAIDILEGVKQYLLSYIRKSSDTDPS